MSDLIISGVIDRDISGSPFEALEFTAINAIDDLSIYSVGVAPDGLGSDVFRDTLPAISLEAGEKFYFSAFGSVATSFEEFLGFAPTSATAVFLTFDGNDEIGRASCRERV